MNADQPLINTGVLSQSPAQFSSLWALREGVPEAISKEGKAYKYDISVPLSSFKDVVDGTREHLRAKGLLGEHAVKHVVGYGHCGDGMTIPVVWSNQTKYSNRQFTLEHSCKRVYKRNTGCIGALYLRGGR